MSITNEEIAKALSSLVDAVNHYDLLDKTQADLRKATEENERLICIHAQRKFDLGRDLAAMMVERNIKCFVFNGTVVMLLTHNRVEIAENLSYITIEE